MTRKAYIETAVARVGAEDQANRTLWHMVSALETALQIEPHDRRLVMAIGNGPELSGAPISFFFNDLHIHYSGHSFPLECNRFGSEHLRLPKTAHRYS